MKLFLPLPFSFLSRSFTLPSELGRSTRSFWSHGQSSGHGCPYISGCTCLFTSLSFFGGMGGIVARSGMHCGMIRDDQDVPLEFSDGVPCLLSAEV